MKLQTIPHWIESTFAEGSRPHYNTVLKWVSSKKIPSVKIGANVYIPDDSHTPTEDEELQRIAAKL